MTDSPTVSSVRITGPDGVDHTATYESLYRITAGPLRALTAGPADALVLTLLCIAKNGSKSTVGSLPWDLYDRIIDIGNDGEGTFTTESGWTVTVTKDDVVADAFSAATAEYHAAAGKVTAAATALLIDRARRTWPTAIALTLLGAYNEDGVLRLDVDIVHLTDGTITGDSDDMDAVEQLETFQDDVHDVLGYLGETAGDDYLHSTFVPLVDESLFDAEGSASSQHYIDTGRYLTHAEVAEYTTSRR